MVQLRYVECIDKRLRNALLGNEIKRHTHTNSQSCLRLPWRPIWVSMKAEICEKEENIFMGQIKIGQIVRRHYITRLCCLCRASFHHVPTINNTVVYYWRRFVCLVGWYVTPLNLQGISRGLQGAAAVVAFWHNWMSHVPFCLPLPTPRSLYVLPSLR